jgi:hypothetical protein
MLINVDYECICVCVATAAAAAKKPPVKAKDNKPASTPAGGERKAEKPGGTTIAHHPSGSTATTVAAGAKKAPKKGKTLIPASVHCAAITADFH